MVKYYETHPGMKFTEQGFRYAFKQPMTGGMKLLNRLIKDGIIEKNGKEFVVKS